MMHKLATGLIPIRIVLEISFSLNSECATSLPVRNSIGILLVVFPCKPLGDEEQAGKTENAALITP